MIWDETIQVEDLCTFLKRDKHTGYTTSVNEITEIMKLKLTNISNTGSLSTSKAIVILETLLTSEKGVS